MQISFGPFAFDRQSGLLWRDGAEIALPPRVLGVLELLVDRAGQVVARQDLLDAVWKDAFVTDTSLAEAVSFLRQALGDDPQAPRYIQTVHRRGYRFLAPVIPDAARPLSPNQAAEIDSGARLVSATSESAKAAISWELVPWSVAVLCAALAAAAVWGISRQPGPEAPPIARFEVHPAPGTTFHRSTPAIAVSADGRTIAWAACTQTSGACSLYTRGIDRLESVAISGSEGASAPFFSPDGRWIGFFADGKLKKIAVSGGSASNLADAPSPGGATWGPNGQIAFAGNAAGGISLLSDEGGIVSALTMPRADRGEVRHLYPAWLPSGGLIFTATSTTLPGAPGELTALAPRGREWRTLRSGVTRAAPAGGAYLLLSSGNDLQAATFDERTLTLTGVSDSVLSSASGGRGIADFAIGGDTLASTAAASPERTAWADGADAGALARWSSIAISPDSRRAAGVVADGAGSDIWMLDIPSGAVTRMTYGGSNVSPAWSADSTRLYFARRTSRAFSLVSRRIDDRDITPVPIDAASPHVFPASVASDGRIAVTTLVASAHTAVAIVPAAGGSLQVLASGPFDEASPAFSPDSHWLAVESAESGRTEVVVRDFRDGRRIPISTNGGAHPRWSADARWIYYDAGPRFMRAPFDPDRAATGTPETLHDGTSGRVVAVTPSGRMLIASSSDGTDRAFVILQWLRELRQRLPLPVSSPR